MFVFEEVTFEIENNYHIKQLVAVSPCFFIATEENQVIHYEEERYRGTCCLKSFCFLDWTINIINTDTLTHIARKFIIYLVFDVDLKKKKNEVKIHNIFVDPTGCHLIISATNGDNFYTNTVANKNPKLIPKMKLVIESVAWDRQTVTKDNTGILLIGTADSCIYEARLENGKDPLKHLKLVCTTFTTW